VIAASAGRGVEHEHEHGSVGYWAATFAGDPAADLPRRVWFRSVHDAMTDAVLEALLAKIPDVERAQRYARHAQAARRAWAGARTDVGVGEVL
jgi:hypothetical protein